MKSIDYLEKLKDPRWQKKRLEILQRDNWTCKNCLAKERTLHVHHIFYFPKVEPWDIHPGFLITLCEECHEAQRFSTEKITDEIGMLLNDLWSSGFDCFTDLVDIAYAFHETKRPEGSPLNIEIIAKREVWGGRQ